MEAPLTEATFFILLSLAPSPRHGYAIMKDVEALSDGRIVFSTGTLYGAIKRLLEQDLIARADSDTESIDGRGRKDYLLTDAGRHLLVAEVNRLQSLARLGALRLAELER